MNLSLQLRQSIVIYVNYAFERKVNVNR